jgi:hypothetical protein
VTTWPALNSVSGENDGNTRKKESPRGEEGQTEKCHQRVPQYSLHSSDITFLWFSRGRQAKTHSNGAYFSSVLFNVPTTFISVILNDVDDNYINL